MIIMKKNFITVAATALVFAACSQSSLVSEINENDIPIGFESYSNLATKAISSTDLEDYHTTFGVSGYKTYGGSESTIMDHYKVINDDNNGTGTYDWDYDGDNAPNTQTIKYWDKMATKYVFDAYAPYSAKASISNHVISIEDGAYAANQNLQESISKTLNSNKFTTSTDWMTASETRNATRTPARISTEVVNLSFGHILSKVIVIVKTKTDFAKDIVINSLSLDDVYGSGSYDGTDWTVSETAVSVDGVVGTIKDENKTDGVNNDNYYTIECLVIPQTSATPKFSVNYKIGSDNETFDVSKVEIDGITSFAKGTVYTITVTIGPDPIEFDCSVSAWSENNSGEVTI